MKRLVEIIDIKDPEVEYFIVRALENTNKEAGESQFEVTIDDRHQRRGDDNYRQLHIYKIENIPAETPKTGF